MFASRVSDFQTCLPGNIYCAISAVRRRADIRPAVQNARVLSPKRTWSRPGETNGTILDLKCYTLLIPVLGAA